MMFFYRCLDELQVGTAGQPPMIKGLKYAKSFESEIEIIHA
jgi:hypothetical protein